MASCFGQVIYGKWFMASDLWQVALWQAYISRFYKSTAICISISVWCLCTDARSRLNPEPEIIILMKPRHQSQHFPEHMSEYYKDKELN